MAELKLTVSDELQQQFERMLASTAREVFKQVSEKEQKAKPYMNFTEASQYAGVATNTLAAWRREYGLKTISVAGKTLISKETLDQFLKSFEQ